MGEKAFALLPQVGYFQEQLADRSAGDGWCAPIRGLANHTTLVGEERSLTS